MVGAKVFVPCPIPQREREAENGGFFEVPVWIVVEGVPPKQQLS